MTDRLYIAAKAPVPGRVKTRLGEAVGMNAAAALYRAFLVDLAARFGQVGYDVRWYATPLDAWMRVARAEPWAAAFPFLVQPDGDWTVRQQALFRGAQARGEGRTVLIASDSPHVTTDVVADAFEALARNDIVLGPTLDGGYYLIGMSRWHDVLAGVEMSVPDVAAAILARAGRLGLTVALVDPTFDVDEAEDLDELRRVAAGRSDLAHTNGALGPLRSAVGAR